VKKLFTWVVTAYKSKGTLYRLVWTSVTVAAGIAATQWSDDPTIGFAVAFLVQVATSEARKHLGTAN